MPADIMVLDLDQLDRDALDARAPPRLRYDPRPSRPHHPRSGPPVARFSRGRVLRGGCARCTRPAGAQMRGRAWQPRPADSRSWPAIEAAIGDHYGAAADGPPRGGDGAAHGPHPTTCRGARHGHRGGADRARRHVVHLWRRPKETAASTTSPPGTVGDGAAGAALGASAREPARCAADGDVRRDRGRALARTGSYSSPQRSRRRATGPALALASVVTARCIPRRIGRPAQARWCGTR